LRSKHRNFITEANIERADHLRTKLGINVGPPKPAELPRCYKGVKQTFAMYVQQHDTPYGRSMVELTKVGGLVNLGSFYDMGRLPLHLGGGYGRVMWIALRGSKWLDFKTWAGFRELVFDRDHGECCKCGKSVRGVTFVCDHKIPLFKGGRDWWQDPEMINFQTLCEECNKVKTRLDMAVPVKAKEKAQHEQHLVSLGFLFEKPVNHQLDKFLITCC